MTTAFHTVKLVVKLLLFIIFLPVILVWLLIRYCIYRAVLLHNLVQSGMPENAAKSLVRELGPLKMFRTHPNKR